MRRAINTIKKEEYNQLLKEAAQRMSKTFFRLCEEEDIKMREADDKGNFDKAEKHDFNARALMCMADMYYNIFKLDKIDNIVNINKVWHEGSEKPDTDKGDLLIIVKDAFGKYVYVHQNAYYVLKYGCVRWAYIKDLIPNKEGEQ